MMYKVLIADDEPIEVKSLEYIISKRIPEAEILPSARSGRDAVEKAAVYFPDIVLMDIHMPGINGIDAIREIIKSSPNSHFVITTAYNYFDYASQAIDLAVDEYLLKPIREEKLLETMNKVITKISARRERLRAEMELKEKLEMSIPYLEKGFVNDICLSENSGAELKNYCRLFGIANERGYIAAIEFGERVKGEIQNKIGVGIKSEKLYSSYCAILKSKLDCIIGPVMLNRIIVFVPDDGTSGDFEQKTAAVSSLGKFLSEASELCPDISIGIGTRCDIGDIKKSYREALAAVRFIAGKDDENILHYSDIAESGQSSDDEYYREVFGNMIYRPMASGDRQSAVAAFETFFETAREKSPDIDALKNRCILIAAGIANSWGASLTGLSEVITALITASTAEQLKDICVEHISSTTEQLVSKKQVKVNVIIEKADSFISKNYMNEITLDDIAKSVNLSPFYFSHFYKEKTGKSVIDSLISCRMEEAKRLLCETDMSVKEISFATGYQDQNYFSKTFKKNTGMTASEYKESCGRQ